MTKCPTCGQETPPADCKSPPTAEEFRAWLVGEINERAVNYHKNACGMYAEEAYAIAAYIGSIEINGGKPLNARGGEIVTDADLDAALELAAHKPQPGGGEIKCVKCDNPATIWPAKVCRDHDPDMGLSI